MRRPKLAACRPSFVPAHGMNVILMSKEVGKCDSGDEKVRIASEISHITNI